MKKLSKFAILFLIVVTILNYIPIILTIIYSFNESKITSVYSGISFKWYEQLFKDNDLKKAFLNSLIISFSSCILSLVIALTAALATRKVKLFFDDLLLYFSTLPIMIPEIILGMVFMATFSYMNLPFGYLTLILSHTSFCIPYIFMIVRARLIGMDKSYEEAAIDLGANKFQIFFDIILPYILPAILSGLLLAFAMSFDDVVISIFTTGATVNTLAIKIYTRMKTGVTPEINSLATIIFIVTIVFIIISEKFNNRNLKDINK